MLLTLQGLLHFLHPANVATPYCYGPVRSLPNKDMIPENYYWYFSFQFPHEIYRIYHQYNKIFGDELERKQTF